MRRGIAVTKQERAAHQASGALRAETVKLQMMTLHGETGLFADELFQHGEIAVGARHRLPAQPADQHMAMAGP